MEFVVFLGNDKENWGQITALLNHLDCDKFILVKDKSTLGFPTNLKCKVININSSSPLLELREEMHNALRKELSKEFEVSISLASGSGKEHMALISALLTIPVGIKLIAYTKKGVEYLS